MKHPTHSELKYYSTHSTLESANMFVKHIKDFVTYKVINYKIREKKGSGQGRKDYDLYVQFGGLKNDNDKVNEIINLLKKEKNI